MGLFGSDEMNLILDKYSFRPGDTIRGAVSLNLKKTIKARKGIGKQIGNRWICYWSNSDWTETNTLDDPCAY